MNRSVGRLFMKFKRPIYLIMMIMFLIFWIRDGGNRNLQNGKGANIRNNEGSSSFRFPSSLLDNYLSNGQNNGNDDALKWSPSWMRSLFGGKKDPEIVIILAANEGGGVLKWKNEQEWAIEKISIENKKAYAKRHGYGLTMKDLATSKRYSHEFREGWQKVDILKQTMREFSTAKWFWWLDMDTLIMEPGKSLEEHIFSRINNITERTLENFNPLKIELDIPYVDYTQDLNLLITQDCGGFNLGSFFIKNTEWSRILLDLWWEPAHYEQKHMSWEHKEQDALESLYTNEGWVRSRVGFLPLRTINSFPEGACSEYSGDKRFFYDETQNDFVVNMAGCNFGRDCWGEMKYFTYLLEQKANKWYNRLF